MAFKSIHTNNGLTRMAAAEASGTPINITHMAVGDGNGNPVTPSPTQTGLAREMYRHAPNRVYQDPDDHKLFTAELIVPASVSGFTMREVAAFDSDGTMLVVGNLPDTYKPSTSEGAYADAVIRLQFYVSNASVVTLQVDPSVAVASQTWVINNMTPASLLPGGTTHQVLRKASNADGDTEWADPTDVSVVVDMVHETQTLAAAQTSVALVTCTTNGLALYIEGVRLRPDQWSIVDATNLTLAASYPAGSKIVCVQNEPAGSLVYPLGRDNNLSDVPNKATARTNLDVYSKAEAQQLQPPGMIGHYAGTVAPAGWLARDGSAISRAAYPALFSVIGTMFGAGDGVNTFNLPDDRNIFDCNAGSGLAVGTAQTASAGTITMATGFGGFDGQPTSSESRPAINSLTLNGTTNSGTVTVTPGNLHPASRAYLPIIKT